jgi:hypothetical protein
LRFHRSHPAGFFFGAAAGFFFGLAPGLVFNFAVRLGFRAHLRFNLSAQAGFVFRPAQGALFSVTASFLFSATLGGLLSEHSRIFSRLAASIFTRLHSGDLDLDGLESHFGMPAQFIFLSTLSSFGFQEPALFYGRDPRLLLLGLSSRFQLRAVRFFGSEQTPFNVSAARIFHGPHAFQFFFGAGEFLLGDLAVILLLGVLATFGGDSLLLLFRALPRIFGSRLAATLMLNAQRILSRQSARFKLRPAGLLFRFQTNQLGFQLLDLFAGESGRRVIFGSRLG